MSFLYRLILGNYLAQKSLTARNKLRACLIISVPWNVFEATKNTEENYFNLMLNKHLASNLCRTIERHHTSDVGPFNIDIDTVLKVYIYGYIGRSNIFNFSDIHISCLRQKIKFNGIYTFKIYNLFY